MIIPLTATLYRHARHAQVQPSDVMLLSRRNEGLEAVMRSYMDKDGESAEPKGPRNEQGTPESSSRKKQKTAKRTSTIEQVDLTSDKDDNDLGLLSFLDDED